MSVSDYVRINVLWVNRLEQHRYTTLAFKLTDRVRQNAFLIRAHEVPIPRVTETFGFEAVELVSRDL